MTLYEVQKRICEILRNDEVLMEHGVAACIIDAGDAAAEVEKALNDTGLCVAVQTCEWQQKSEASKNAVGEGTVTIAVGEIPALCRPNGNGVNGQNLAEYIAWRLQLEPIVPGKSVLTLEGKISTAFDEKAATAVTTMTFKFMHQLSNTLGDNNEA